ncbi:MAG: carboxypeptidase-like regulatory domain-containing protein [Thermoplasmata archaeon]
MTATLIHHSFRRNALVRMSERSCIRKRKNSLLVYSSTSFVFLILAIIFMQFFQAGVVPDLPAKSAAPPTPMIVIGYTLDSNGSALPFCSVNITNMRTGESALTSSDNYGKYQFNLANLPSGASAGDMIHVVANNTMYIGENASNVPSGVVAYMWINVTLEILIPEFPFVLGPIFAVVVIFIAVDRLSKNFRQ